MPAAVEVAVAAVEVAATAVAVDVAVVAVVAAWVVALALELRPAGLVGCLGLAALTWMETSCVETERGAKRWTLYSSWGWLSTEAQTNS
jgi:hypothetical protein